MFGFNLPKEAPSIPKSGAYKQCVYMCEKVCVSCRYCRGSDKTSDPPSGDPAGTADPWDTEQRQQSLGNQNVEAQGHLSLTDTKSESSKPHFIQSPPSEKMAD